MKISAFILSFCGFCVFYICNADWVDELIEYYLGNDYDEIGPFISSVTAGTDEFDQIVEELSHPKRQRWISSPLVLAMALCFISLSVVFQCQVARTIQRQGIMKAAFKFLSSFKQPGTDKEEIQTIVAEFLEKKLKQFCGSKRSDDIPVKLLWKGGSLVESSVHCNIKDESKPQNVQRHFLHSKVLFNSPGLRREENMILVPSSSETSTARKMTEIRRLLESEQELEMITDGGNVNPKKEEHRKESRGELPRDEVSQACKRPQGRREGRETDQDRIKASEDNWDSELNSGPDPKLMNRIRLLESRLRLEELKNKNWINRMSRAEGILQKLNKQVEEIEETRPVSTLTKTLKITSTVTNWCASSNPRRDMCFTMVNQYPPFCVQMPYTSLTELITKEVGLPTSLEDNQNLFQLPPSPQIPALTSPIVMPQSSLLSKFLCR